MSDQDEAVLKVRTEGFQEASREAEAFLALLDKMRNAGTANPSASAGAGLPAGAQPGAVDPGNGLTGVGFNQSPVSNLQSFGQFGTPILGGTGLPQNPYYVTPANPGNGLNYNTGGQGGAPPTPTTQVVNAQTVVINSPGGAGVGPSPYAQNFQQPPGAPPTPLDNGIGTIPGTPSAGGRGGGFFGGFGRGGGGWGGSTAGGGENPLPDWNPGESSYSGWSRSGVGLASALALAAIGAQSYYAYTQPGFQARLGIESTQLGGNYISPITASTNLAIAQGQGNLNLAHTLAGALIPIGAAIGGIIGTPADVVSGPLGTFAGAAIGGGIGGAASSGLNSFIDITMGRQFQTMSADSQASANRDLAMVQFLRRNGIDPSVAGSILSVYRSGNADSINNLNSGLSSSIFDLPTYVDRMQVASLNSVRSLGSGVMNGVLNSRSISAAINNGVSIADITAGNDAYFSAVNNPAMGDLRSRVQSGGPVNIQSDILQQYIASGDTASILALQSAQLITPSQASTAINQSFSLQQAQVAGNTAQSRLGIVQSGIQQQSATGASLAGIGRQTVSSASLYNPIIASLTTQLAQAPNENARASIQAQIAGIQAQQAGTVQQGVQTELQSGALIASADIGFASNQMTTAQYGGSQSSVNSAFEAQRRAYSAQASNLRQQAANPLTSPEQRQNLLAQAISVEQQANIQTPAQQFQYNLGITQSQIGINSSRVSRDITQAGLFGTPQQQYTASMEQVGVVREQIDMQNQIIEAYKQHKATLQDAMAAEAKLTDLKQQEITITTQSAREYAQLNLAIAGATYGLAQTQASIGAGIGMSNAEIAPLLATSSQDAGDVLTKAQAALATLQKTGGSPKDFLAANQDIANAKASIINAAIQQVTAGPGSAVQLAQTKAGIDTTVASNTFTPWGNRQGAYNEKLDADIAAGEQDRLSVQRAKATADAAAVKLGYAPGSQQTIDLENITYNAALQRVGGDVANITADQQQLQTGWMDRLISSTFNMPSRSAYVDTQFTQMEASKYTQGISSIYGTNQIGARNNWMFYGHRLANNLLNNPQTPEGFTSAGLNMAAGGVGTHGMAAVLSAPSTLSKPSTAPEIWVNVVLRDEKGNVKARGRALASTLHDNSNGAITLAGTPYHVATQ